MSSPHITRAVDALEIVSAIALEDLTRDLEQACYCMHAGSVILNTITRLGYLTAADIEEATHIKMGLAAVLQNLCDNNLLQKIKIGEYEVRYWPTAEGIRAAGRIRFTTRTAGVQVLALADMPSKTIRDLAKVRLSHPKKMNHVITCAAVNARIESHFAGLVIGERCLSAVEVTLKQQGAIKPNDRIGTFKTGHSPDAIVISPQGKITAIEVECSSHAKEEDEVAMGALPRSANIALGLYVASGRRTLRDVNQRVERLEKAKVRVRKKVRVLAWEHGNPPDAALMRPAGVEYRIKEPRLLSEHGPDWR